ncbi:MULTISPECIES: AraC family transcriptional regulator [Terrabacteria group]|uniref:AraC family transcriptional regulator n=1 Tax=Bacillati TaxID=1783272 RepID=UPI00193AC834|nr:MULTISPECIES: AraC family transcriptional regulator [Terrabacteria group]MBW9212683.1 AraC family transcriptional regulator [Trueperella sp. zg.1013]MBW9213174.1 AraC family transcriptional regulator [Trueperella sp. zg.1013]QRG86831.1 helix-turn-helix domain-containing protein [Bulleidia sp. zg-1006]
MDQEIKNLEKKLFTHTENELYYLSHAGSYSKKYELGYSKRKFIKGKEVIEVTTRQLENSPLFIRKDSRYNFMPFHIFTNLNVNYIYSGKCAYFIEDKEIILEEGDICFFDTQVVRAKMKPKFKDIIINIVMSNDYFKSLLTVNTNNTLSTFMNKALYSNESHDNYIIFKTAKNPKIRHLFQYLLIEYYEDNPYKLYSIQNYFSIILLELFNPKNDYLTSTVHFSDQKSNHVFNIVNYLNNNYKTATLTQVAKLFGYHEKYLSNLLKKNYGKTFKEIQIDNKILEVEKYLLNSSLTIEKIAENTGFSNLNILYKYFKDKNGVSPNQFRRNHDK